MRQRWKTVLRLLQDELRLIPYTAAAEPTGELGSSNSQRFK